MENILTQVTIASGVFTFFAILLAMFLAFLPIYFMIGTLTRLTDIKSKLDEIIEVVKMNDHSSDR